jgi:NitT/TauT family transport system substrate-binding protein
VERLRKWACVTLALALALTGCSAAGESDSGGLTPITVCYSALAATQIPVLYAFEKGMFEAQGLAVELVYLESGTAAATAMIADEVDVCQIAGSSVVNAAVAGEDVIILAGLFNTYVYSLLVAPDIASPIDLAGRTVAVSRVGSSSDAAMRAALTSFGLEPDRDVTILEVGGQSNRVTALESGEISGTVVSIPESSRAIRAGYPELLDMSSLNIPYQHTAIATTRSYLEGHREAAVAFMRALLDAIESMKTDRQGTMGVMSQYLGLDPQSDADLLAAAYDELIPTYLADVPEPTEPGIQTLLDQLAPENPAALNYHPDQLVDRNVLADALLKAGGE